MDRRYEKLLVQLDFPPYPFRLQEQEGKLYIFDPLRKKYLVCTPEEWVRQHLVQYMTRTRRYPRSLVQIEGGLSVNERKRRSDVLFFDPQGKEYLLAECKSPNVTLSNSVFEQAALYNTRHQAKYLLITNGLRHFCCQIDHINRSYRFLEDIPSFPVSSG
ncbi:MAG TPA: type I restriction enzyme HsdR N-terminal domain-containing protein [Anseongella sp.]